jgi:hypothetical protein
LPPNSKGRLPGLIANRFGSSALPFAEFVETGKGNPPFPAIEPGAATRFARAFQVLGKAPENIY